jgi:hypothetical protein
MMLVLFDLIRLQGVVQQCAAAVHHVRCPVLG